MHTSIVCVYKAHRVKLENIQCHQINGKIIQMATMTVMIYISSVAHFHNNVTQTIRSLIFKLLFFFSSDESEWVRLFIIFFLIGLNSWSFAKNARPEFFCIESPIDGKYWNKSVYTPRLFRFVFSMQLSEHLKYIYYSIIFENQLFILFIVTLYIIVI